MDIRQKAQWHLDLNNGFMPVLENTDGNMVFESAVIMSLASDLARPGEGLPIWPHEAAEPGNAAAAMATAQMRLDMLTFDKMGNKMWGAYLSRYKNDAPIQELAAVLPDLENFIA